jgi:hypothetical protein
MALQFVGYGAQGAIGANPSAISLTSLSGGIDTVARTNDVVVVVLGDCAGSDRTSNETLSETGYTTDNSAYANSAGAGDTSGKVFWKVMGGTPDTTVTPTGSIVANKARALSPMYSAMMTPERR